MKVKPLLELLEIAAERDKLAAQQRALDEREARLLGTFRLSQGDLLRQAREQAGLSQSEAASVLDVSPQYVNMVERGKKYTTPARLHDFTVKLGGQMKGGARGSSKRKHKQQAAV